MRTLKKPVHLRISAALGRLWTQRGGLSYRQIRSASLIYILPLVIICRLLDQRNTFFPPHTLFWGNDASAISYACYAVGTLVVLAFWNKRNIGWLKALSVTALFGFALWVVMPEGDSKSAAMFLCQFAIGGAAIYATFAHVFALNNAERLLSVLLITLNHGVFVILRESGIDNLFLSLILPGLLLMLLAFSVFCFQISLFPEPVKGPEIKPPKNIYLLLGVSLSFYTLDILGEELVKRCATGNDVMHGAGLLFAVALTIIILSGFKRSVWYTLNLSLAFALVGLTLLAMPLDPEAHSIGNLLFGIGDGFGFMTTFYMIGIIKRYRSGAFFRKITAVTTGELLAAILAVDIFSIFLPQALPVAAVGLTFFFLCGFTLLAPAFQRNIFDSEWIDDYKKYDITFLERKAEAEDYFEGLGLSPREKEVAVLLLQGLTLRQISANLSIAESTVGGYCRSLYRKLGINSKTELFVRFGAVGEKWRAIVAARQKEAEM